MWVIIAGNKLSDLFEINGNRGKQGNLCVHYGWTYFVFVFIKYVYSLDFSRQLFLINLQAYPRWELVKYLTINLSNNQQTKFMSCSPSTSTCPTMRTTGSSAQLCNRYTAIIDIIFMRTWSLNHEPYDNQITKYLLCYYAVSILPEISDQSNT